MTTTRTQPEPGSTLLSDAYIAGFFDGEGCIGIYTAGTVWYQLRVQLTQNKTPCSLMILEQLQTRFGGAVSRQITATERIKLNWQVNNDPAAAFLRTILSFLVLKAEQARIGIEWQETRPNTVRGPRGWPVRIPRAEDAEAAALLKKLKRC